MESRECVVNKQCDGLHSRANRASIFLTLVYLTVTKNKAAQLLVNQHIRFLYHHTVIQIGPSSFYLYMHALEDVEISAIEWAKAFEIEIVENSSSYWKKRAIFHWALTIAGTVHFFVCIFGCSPKTFKKKALLMRCRNMCIFFFSNIQLGATFTYFIWELLRIRENNIIYGSCEMYIGNIFIDIDT